MQHSPLARPSRRAVALALAFAATTPAQAQSAAEFAGQRQFLRCGACHTIAAGAPNKVGPNLNGVAGRKAAAAPGFTYSAALKASGIVWTDAALDKWLTRPSALVPGTTMAFAGLAKPEDRAALIAYLKRTSKK